MFELHLFPALAAVQRNGRFPPGVGFQPELPVAGFPGGLLGSGQQQSADPAPSRLRHHGQPMNDGALRIAAGAD